MSQGYLYDEGNDLITRKESSGGLPDPSEASAGDVLSLDEDKEPVWSAPSGGGGGGVIILEYDNTKQVITEGDNVYVPLSHTSAEIQNGSVPVLHVLDYANDTVTEYPAFIYPSYYQIEENFFTVQYSANNMSFTVMEIDNVLYCQFYNK